jgi:hypothetical protein
MTTAMFNSRYLQPITHDGQMLEPNGKHRGDILFMQRDFRADYVSVPRMTALAAAEAGYRVLFEDPFRLVPKQSWHAAFDLRIPVPLALSDRAREDAMDIVVINNFPVDWNANHCKPSIVFMYDEPWKGQFIPPGTEYVLTYQGGWTILNKSVDPKGYLVNSRKKIAAIKKVFFNSCIPAISPQVWPEGLTENGECRVREFWIDDERDEKGVLLPPHWERRLPSDPHKSRVITVPKDVPMAYNGMLRSDRTNEMMQLAKQRITWWAETELNCVKFEEPGLEIDKFLEFVPRCKYALHYSASDVTRYEGVGQGAWENMVCGNVTFEYPYNKLSEDEGLIDYKTCLFFDNEEQLKEKWVWANAHPKECLEIAKAGREVALKHTYHEMVPRLREIFEEIITNESPVKHVGQWKCDKK